MGYEHVFVADPPTIEHTFDEGGGQEVRMGSCAVGK